MFGFRRSIVSTIRFPQLRIRKLHYLSVTLMNKSDGLQCTKRISTVGCNFTKHYVNKVDDHIATYEDVVESVNKPKTIIVDVRNPDEVKAAGQIPSSINIPLNNIEQVLGSMSEDEFKRNYHRSKPSQSDKIIFYCKSGKRATKATDIAINLGYSKSKKFLGSWDEWSSRQM